MSEKTKKSETVESAAEIIILSSNKHKHNSKRRSQKEKKDKVESEVFRKEPKKLNEIVNYLCSTISNSECQTSLNVTPVEIPEDLQNMRGNYSERQSYQNSKFECSKQTPSTSSGDLSTLFKNLQVHAEKNPLKSNNTTDVLDVGGMIDKYSECFFLEDLKWLKFKKLHKRHYLNELYKDTSKNIYQDIFNLNLIQNCPERSVLAEFETGTSYLVPETDELQCPTTEYSAKSSDITEYFIAEKLLPPKDDLMDSIRFPPKLLWGKLNRTPESEPLKKKLKKKKNKYLITNVEIPNEIEPLNGNQKVVLKKELTQDYSELNFEIEPFKKKLKKKKKKHLTTNVEIPNEIETLNGNQKVVLKEELTQDCCESTNLKSQDNGKGKKQHSQKVLSATGHRFPKYLSVDELQSLSELGVLMSGVIRINPKNYKEAYITAPDKGMDILIEGLRDRNRALEGDEVYFILKATEHHRVTCDSTDVQRTAVVVGLKTLNHNRGAIGTLNVIKNKSSSFVLLSPRDSKLPRLKIERNNWPKGFLENSESFKDKLYFAKISHWNDMRYADGELIKEIGTVGNLEAETKAILLKQGLNVTPFDEAVKKFLPPVTFKILDCDIVNREDFRKDCVFTIDPDSAVDLDDAVSCKRLPNGNCEVGVHISDVSYFLKEGTPLDQAVGERATAVYLVQKAYHMLPDELCRLCSLTPGEDKLSFSVIWEITNDYKIINHRFSRSIINSCAQFSYNQVQSIIDNVPVDEMIFPKIYGNHSTENIKEIIFFLHKAAVYLRNKRFENGALKIDQKKIHFSLDENRLPVDYTEYSQKPSHQMIEEFMLLANITVAEQLNSYFPDLAFLRSHSPPLPYMLKKLQKTLEKFGIIIDISSSKSLQSSLSRYSGGDYESVARMLVLNNSLAKPMTRAKYYCAGLFSNEEERRHYALCVPLYTHFTSPIRRYADVMVHRLLASSLRYCDTPKWTSEHIQQIAENCNKKKYAAKLAEEMSIELYYSVYIGLRGSLICDAVVCDIKDKSFDCIGLTTGIHQRLYFEHIQGEVKQKKEDGIWSLTVKWPINENQKAETIQIIEIFSIVKIELKRISVLKIEASLLRNE